MAGHSKWANIKHRKARQDAVKGKSLVEVQPSHHGGGQERRS